MNHKSQDKKKTTFFASEQSVHGPWLVEIKVVNDKMMCKLFIILQVFLLSAVMRSLLD